MKGVWLWPWLEVVCLEFHDFFLLVCLLLRLSFIMFRICFRFFFVVFFMSMNKMNAKCVNWKYVLIRELRRWVIHCTWKILALILYIHMEFDWSILKFLKWIGFFIWKKNKDFFVKLFSKWIRISPSRNSWQI